MAVSFFDEDWCPSESARHSLAALLIEREKETEKAMEEEQQGSVNPLGNSAKQQQQRRDQGGNKQPHAVESDEDDFDDNASADDNSTNSERDDEGDETEFVGVRDKKSIAKRRRGGGGVDDWVYCLSQWDAEMDEPIATTNHTSESHQQPQAQGAHASLLHDAERSAVFAEVMRLRGEQNDSTTTTTTTTTQPNTPASSSRVSGGLSARKAVQAIKVGYALAYGRELGLLGRYPLASPAISIFELSRQVAEYFERSPFFAESAEKLREIQRSASASVHSSDKSAPLLSSTVCSKYKLLVHLEVPPVVSVDANAARRRKKRKTAAAAGAHATGYFSPVVQIYVSVGEEQEEETENDELGKFVVAQSSALHDGGSPSQRLRLVTNLGVFVMSLHTGTLFRCPTLHDAVCSSVADAFEACSSVREQVRRCESNLLQKPQHHHHEGVHQQNDSNVKTTTTTQYLFPWWRRPNVQPQEQQQQQQQRAPLVVPIGAPLVQALVTRR